MQLLLLLLLLLSFLGGKVKTLITEYWVTMLDTICVITGLLCMTGVMSHHNVPQCHVGFTDLDPYLRLLPD